MHDLKRLLATWWTVYGLMTNTDSMRKRWWVIILTWYGFGSKMFRLDNMFWNSARPDPVSPGSSPAPARSARYPARARPGPFWNSARSARDSAWARPVLKLSPARQPSQKPGPFDTSNRYCVFVCFQTFSNKSRIAIKSGFYIEYQKQIPKVKTHVQNRYCRSWRYL